MKTTHKIALTLTACGSAILALTAGCADNDVPRRPPGVAVVGFVPDYCFWDGFEYVGWYGNEYYYWGPNDVWILCDPVRVRRVHVWVHEHPRWQTQAVPLVQSRPAPRYQPHPNLPPVPSGIHHHGRDRDHDHDFDHD